MGHFPAKQGRIYKVTTIEKSFPSLRGNVNVVDKGELKLKSELKINQKQIRNKNKLEIKIEINQK